LSLGYGRPFLRNRRYSSWRQSWICRGRLGSWLSPMRCAAGYATSRDMLPRRLFELLEYLIDIVLISRRCGERRFQNVRDGSFSVDYEPVRIILHPAAPPQGAARNAINRGSATGRVRQRRGKDQAFFIAERSFAAAEQPVFLFEDSGSIRIQRHHD